MRITILDTATVFEMTDPNGEPTTICRNDLVPDDSTLWLDAVVDQARDLVGGDWNDNPVTVVATDPGSAALLADILVADGAEVQFGRLARPDDEGIVGSESGAPTEVAFRIRRPRTGRRHRSTFRPTLFHIAVVVIVLCVAGVAWWSAAPDAEDTDTVGGTGVPTSSVTRPSAAAEKILRGQPMEPTPDPPTPAPAPVGGVVLEAGNIRVMTPAGYVLNPGDRGGVTATGPDPDLRIHLSADPLLGTPPGIVLEEVSMQVETDPVLHRSDRAGRRPGAEVVTYRESPGDGSFVEWITWVEDGHQMSVGCHTRISSTVSQRAICRMATDSVGLRKEEIPEFSPE
ncbi:type VII secretion-associated protein [Corynebacterium sp. CCM 9204]|uniref:type VII secretion-associated protein n=1 Tax=Corynebacterium sp. CCM 9204 TaxID=3057616 RepID=UPI0035241710